MTYFDGSSYYLTNFAIQQDLRCYRKNTRLVFNRWMESLHYQVNTEIRPVITEIYRNNLIHIIQYLLTFAENN